MQRAIDNVPREEPRLAMRHPETEILLPGGMWYGLSESRAIPQKPSIALIASPAENPRGIASPRFTTSGPKIVRSFKNIHEGHQKSGGPVTVVRLAQCVVLRPSHQGARLDDPQRMRARTYPVRFSGDEVPRPGSAAGAEPINPPEIARSRLRECALEPASG